MFRHGAVIIAVLCVSWFGAHAAPVDHDAPGGIAAVASIFGELALTSVRGEMLEFPMFALGTDGKVYRVNHVGELTPYGFGDKDGAEWPVDFATIVDWTPAAINVPWYDPPLVTRGTILTASGDRWVHCVEKVSGDWDTPGQIKMKSAWKKLTLPVR